MTEKIHTVCGMCGVNCGIEVTVEEGKVVDWEPSDSHSWLGGKCPKFSAMADNLYSPNRLLNPLQRKNNKWKRISWDETLDIISDRLNEIKQDYGPEAFAINMGHPHIGDEMMWALERFAYAYGTPNMLSMGNDCWYPMIVSDAVTFGDYMYWNAGGTECLLNWGGNLWESGPAVELRKRLKSLSEEIPIITVDPRRTRLAELSDIHLQVLPGTDGALALGFMNVIISRNLYDKEFVERWTTGFDKLSDKVKKYTPTKVEEITRVPADKIVEAATLYAKSEPATLYSGVGIQSQHSNAFQTNRAISCLKAITGNVDKEGGSQRSPAPSVKLGTELKEKVTKKAKAEEEFPLFCDEISRINYPVEKPDAIMADQMISGDIKAAMFMGRAFVKTRANAERTREALEHCDFTVVMDLRMTETAKLADLVLPAATLLERNSLRTYWLGGGLPLATLAQKVIEPIGESKSDLNFILELSKRMGLEEFFPWEGEEAFLDEICQQMGTSLTWMKEHPMGFFFAPREFEKYKEEGFNTESGKVELYSEKMKRYGYEPLPTYNDPPEIPRSNPDLATEYPLVLTTGGRTAIFEHSNYRDIPRLRKKFPDPLVEINPNDAEKYGIKDETLVEISTKRGSAQMKAKITDEIMQGVVHAYHGWGGKSNINLVTPEEPKDPVSGAVDMRSCLCKIKQL